MKTPVCDFLREYGEFGTVRMHMPGHKGKPETGCDACDLTEIEGADELYRSRGILRESEENAASLFGTGRTVYSAEGSSLCIRAMLYLASLRAAEEKLPRRILAGRNAHKTLMTAAALLDIEIDWVYPEPEEGLLSCGITAEKISESLNKKAYMAVYVTTLLRLAVLPLGVHLLCTALGFDPFVVGINTVVIAMPVATYGTILCLKYGRDTTLIAELTFVTTLLSMVTIPLLVLWLR